MTRFRQQWNRIKNAHTHSAQKKETTVKLFKWCWQIIIARLCIKYLLGLMRARHHLNRLWHHRTRISLMRVIFIYFDNGLRGVKKNLCFFFLSCITGSSFDSLNVNNIVFYIKFITKYVCFWYDHCSKRRRNFDRVLLAMGWFLIDKITGIFCQQIQHKAHANIM